MWFTKSQIRKCERAQPAINPGESVVLPGDGTATTRDKVGVWTVKFTFGLESEDYSDIIKAMR